MNDRVEVEKYCEQLYRLSLLSQCTSKYIHLHPVASEHLSEYTNRSDLSKLHAKFLGTYVDESGDPKINWYKLLRDKRYLGRLAYHLYEADRKDDLLDLLLNYDWIALKLEVESHDVQAVIRDYKLLLQGEEKGDKEEDREIDEKDRALRAVQQVLRLSKEALAEGSAQLASQLLGRLRGHDMPLAAIKTSAG